MTIGNRGMAMAGVIAALALCGPAVAAQFAVTGTVSFSGSSEALPAGATFGDATYDPVSGYVSSGAFSIPDMTVSNATALGTLTATLRLTQTNSASALVGSDGAAAFTTVNLKLHVVAVTLAGFPINVGATCDFEPIVLDALGGNASAVALAVSQPVFTVPPTTDSCGGFEDQINGALSGNAASIALVLTGDFTPPADDDLIFADGFEP